MTSFPNSPVLEPIRYVGIDQHILDTLSDLTDITPMEITQVELLWGNRWEPLENLARKDGPVISAIHIDLARVSEMGLQRDDQGLRKSSHDRKTNEFHKEFS